MNKLYEISAIKSCEDSIPHNKTGYWLNPVKDESVGVYTQEMADSVIKPLVGMESLWGGDNNDFVWCKVLAKHNGEYWLMLKNETMVVGNPTNFKPLDTRTDKQKAIAEMLSYEPATTFEGLLSDVYDKWVGK